MRVLPRTRRGRLILALVAANEIRGLIIAGPALVALVRYWF